MPSSQETKFNIHSYISVQRLEILPKMITMLAKMITMLPKMITTLPKMVTTLPKMITTLPKMVKALPKMITMLPNVIRYHVGYIILSISISLYTLYITWHISKKNSFEVRCDRRNIEWWRISTLCISTFYHHFIYIVYIYILSTFYLYFIYICQPYMN